MSELYDKACQQFDSAEKVLSHVMRKENYSYLLNKLIAAENFVKANKALQTIDKIERMTAKLEIFVEQDLTKHTDGTSIM